MAVIIGSARIDENGKAHGGKAGDQTGKEVSTQNWYKHSKGWVVLRAKDPKKAAKIAQAMRAACANDNIGYDQYQNQTLWNAVKDKGYDPAKATVKCETDCARLVRVCCAYAGIMARDFYTATEAAYLMDTGEFVKFTSSKYTNQDDYLGAGDILVTKTKGHTAVVLTNGDRYDGEVEEPSVPLGSRILRNGERGQGRGRPPAQAEGRWLRPRRDRRRVWPEHGVCRQSAPEGRGISSWTASSARTATRRCWRLEVDDDAPEAEPAPATGKVLISGGDAWLRTGPGTAYDKAGVAKSGDKLAYANEDNWVPVLVEGRLLWVSGKYAKVEG